MIKKIPAHSTNAIGNGECVSGVYASKFCACRRNNFFSLKIVMPEMEQLKRLFLFVHLIFYVLFSVLINNHNRLMNI